MKKQVLNVAVSSNDTAKVVQGKVKANVSMVDNTSLSIDEEENESPKKKETFARVRSLFGFSLIDKDTLAESFKEEFISGKISFTEYTKKVNDLVKGINKENETRENLTFEQVCDTIENDSIINDVSLFVKTKDLKSLKTLLVDGNNVILFHAKQSEDGDRYDTFKVTKKGLHKPYFDICYTSKVEISTSNIIRALSNYSYYLASLKRVNKAMQKEKILFSSLSDTISILHKEFGYMPDDFKGLLDF